MATVYSSVFQDLMWFYFILNWGRAVKSDLERHHLGYRIARFPNISCCVLVEWLSSLSLYFVMKARLITLCLVSVVHTDRDPTSFPGAAAVDRPSAVL